MNSINDLLASLSGPAVADGRIALRDLVAFCTALGETLERVGQVLAGSESLGSGPAPSVGREACGLALVGLRRGSTVLAFRLASPAQPDPFHDLGRRSLEALLQGMEQIKRAERDPVYTATIDPVGLAFREHGDLPQAGATSRTDLPRGFDNGVLETIIAMGTPLERGVESILLRRPYRRRTTVRYDRESRARMAAVLTARDPAHSSRTALLDTSTVDGGAARDALATSFVPKTEFGRWMLEMRKKVIAAGVPLLDEEGIERELSESRRRVE